MRNPTWLVLTLPLVACTPGATPPPPSSSSTAALDQVLHNAVERKQVPMVVAMVATADGVAWEGAVGVAKDAIFPIASMTKPVTAVAVMQLVESGQVDLDAPASTYVPALATVQVLDHGERRPPKTPVTVRQLLTHTSGFGYEFLSRDLYELVGAGSLPSIMAGGDGFLAAPLLFDPGERWEYGISFDWLGRLVERVSGQTLEAYFHERIFEPLGMKDTFFNVPADKQTRLVRRYQRGEDGRLVELPPLPTEPVSFFSGGGGLHSTAADYLTFTRAILAGGQLGAAPMMKPESVALMGQNQIGELTPVPATSTMPQLVADTKMPGRPDKFGLGFALNSSPIEGGRGAHTLSWAGIFNTFFWIDREKGVCAVVLTQMMPFLDDGLARLVDDFDRAVYAWRSAQS